MDALHETIRRLMDSGMEEQDAIALVTRLLNEEAAGFLYVKEELLRDTEDYDYIDDDHGSLLS